MKMSNELYDTMKWAISLVLPALATLVQTIGQSVSWKPTELVVTILTAVTTFLGAIFMTSSVNHQKNHVTISKDKVYRG